MFKDFTFGPLLYNIPRGAIGLRLHLVFSAQYSNPSWMGHKKSDSVKLGFKPFLRTPRGSQRSNFMFGLIFGPNLGQIWAQKTKKRPKSVFQNGWFSIAFVSIVIWSLKVCNWCFGLFNHFHRLPGVFKIHILYLDLFFGPNLGSEDKKRPKTT